MNDDLWVVGFPNDDSEDVDEVDVMTDAETAYWNIVQNDVQTCYACPTQYEGELKNGRFFYFRYRWGYATLAVRDTLEDARGRSDVGAQLGDSLDGFLSPREYREAFLRLLGEYSREQLISG